MIQPIEMRRGLGPQMRSIQRGAGGPSAMNNRVAVDQRYRWRSIGAEGIDAGAHPQVRPP